MWHETWELLIAGLGSGIAIVIAMFAIIQARSAQTQTNILKEEFESTNRPWIGSNTGIGFEFDKDPTKIRFEYKNFGTIVASSVTERGKVTNTKVTRDSIKNETGFTEATNSICFPSQTHGIFISVPKELRKKIFEGGTAYFWATVDFEYLNSKKGQYGIIIEFRNKEFGITIDEWAV